MSLKAAPLCLFAMLLPCGGAAQDLPSPEQCAALWQGYGVTTDACREALGAGPPPATTESAAEAVASAEEAEQVAASVPVPAAPGITPEVEANHIFFSQGGTDLDDEARDRIRLLAQVLETRNLRDSCLRLIGHADIVGSASANAEISVKRAETVAQELRRWLRQPERVAIVTGAGEDETLAGLDPEAPENRRVAIHARDCR